MESQVTFAINCMISVILKSRVLVLVIYWYFTNFMCDSTSLLFVYLEVDWESFPLDCRFIYLCHFFSSLSPLSVMKNYFILNNRKKWSISWNVLQTDLIPWGCSLVLITYKNNEWTKLCWTPANTFSFVPCWIVLVVYPTPSLTRFYISFHSG